MPNQRLWYLKTVILPPEVDLEQATPLLCDQKDYWNISHYSELSFLEF